MLDGNRKRPDTATLIAQERHPMIRPWAHVNVIAANAIAVLEEAQRAVQHCPECVTFAGGFETVALQELGRHEEAQAIRLVLPSTLQIRHRESSDRHCLALCRSQTGDRGPTLERGFA
jgi:hypothetical protein